MAETIEPGVGPAPLEMSYYLLLPPQEQQSRVVGRCKKEVVEVEVMSELS